MLIDMLPDRSTIKEINNVIYTGYMKKKKKCDRRKIHMSMQFVIVLKKGYC